MKQGYSLVERLNREGKEQVQERDSGKAALPQTHQRWLTGIRDPQLRKAVEVVREDLTRVDGASEVDSRKTLMVVKAQVGDPEARTELQAMIRASLERHKLRVDGLGLPELVELISEESWGLGVLAPWYYDPTVEEIRVNGPTDVYTVRRGVAVREDVQFQDEEEIVTLMRRMLSHDKGVDITRDNPIVETTRLDGSRVTMIRPPFSEYPAMTIRKFTSIVLQDTEFLDLGSVSPEILRMLSVLVQGRISTVISGPTATGKTTLLRLLVGYLPEDDRIVTLESDRELGLRRYYPKRDIIALEAHPELTPPITLKAAFPVILRLSPHVIIMGEARAEEAEELVKASIRGHMGMGTVHVSGVREVVSTMATMILEGNPSRPMDVVQEQVTKAFPIVVQLVRWPNGKKQVEEISEQVWDEETRRVRYQTLCRWEPQEGTPHEGEWIWPETISQGLQQQLLRGGITTREMKEAKLL